MNRIVPAEPTAQMFLLSVPHTDHSPLLVPLTCALQLVPFHLRMVPLPPTAQMLFASLPQMLSSRSVMPLVCRRQVVPFQRMMANENHESSALDDAVGAAMTRAGGSPLLQDLQFWPAGLPRWLTVERRTHTVPTERADGVEVGGTA